MPDPSKARIAAAWSAVGIALALPLAVAASSPLLAWRDPVYILGGLAGVVALALLLLQPLLALGRFPGLSPRNWRVAHRRIGGVLALAVVVHVAALWMTSPPDVLDALLLRAPTPFSVWGVLAMWAVLASALLGLARRRLRLRYRNWRRIHLALAAVIVIGSVLHAMLIEGTMGSLSKAALCLLILAAAARLAAAVRSRAS